MYSPHDQVGTRAARDQWMVFEPQKETFFEVARERLLDRDNRAHLEALNPPRNGAACNVEQIDADRSIGAIISHRASQG